METSLTPAQPTPPVPSSTPPRLRWFSATLIILWGIVLPALTLLIEALTHMCADAFFDPLPSVGHVFAIAVVPFANAVSFWALRRRETTRIDAVIFGQSFAVAISGVYALIFAPMTPVAVFAVMFVSACCRWRRCCRRSPGCARWCCCGGCGKPPGCLRVAWSWAGSRRACCCWWR
jgi:hypothetical protein